VDATSGNAVVIGSSTETASADSVQVGANGSIGVNSLGFVAVGESIVSLANAAGCVCIGYNITQDGGPNNVIVGANANSVSSIVSSVGLGEGVSLTASNALFLAGMTLTASATAGTNGAPPDQVSEYLTVYVNGTEYKLPLYNP
jgi:hypothetical protein